MKLLFIISHKYCRGYDSYLEYYINNIQCLYGNYANILIVDNNSICLEDIHEKISKYKNVELIINTSDCKFELGAYRFGINYINEKINDYEYIIFTQDTFVLKNKYDFNNLILNDVKACTIGQFREYSGNDEKPYPWYNEEIKNVLDHTKFCIIFHNFTEYNTISGCIIELCKSNCIPYFIISEHTSAYYFNGEYINSKKFKHCIKEIQHVPRNINVSLEFNPYEISQSESNLNPETSIEKFMGSYSYLQELKKTNRTVLII
jgi:hypothetical protein